VTIAQMGGAARVARMVLKSPYSAIKQDSMIPGQRYPFGN